MSGEAYERGFNGDYHLYTSLENESYPLTFAKDAMDVLGAICRSMAWGKAGDSCFDCAKLRAIEALDEFFEHHNVKTAQAVAKAGDFKCERCRLRG